MLLLRGATRFSRHATPPNNRFNTCSSCEEQQPWSDYNGIVLAFQYMLLLRGATGPALFLSEFCTFQYMLLLRGATEHERNPAEIIDVSIHAPLARSNYALELLSSRLNRFNTCSSCEEQPVPLAFPAFHKSFNTCSSCEEQLGVPSEPQSTDRFQYMLLLRGATGVRGNANYSQIRFQYMLLLRGATIAFSHAFHRNKSFQYMLLLRGATPSAPSIPKRRVCFNTCSSCEEQLG